MFLLLTFISRPVPAKPLMFNCSLCRYSFTAIILFIVFQSFGQNRSIDSLKALLPSLRDDTVKVNVLNALARELRASRDSNTLVYGNEAYQLAGRLNFSRGKASAAIQLGRYLGSHGKSKEALDLLNEALSIYEKLGIGNGIATCLNNIGVVYLNSGKYRTAIPYFKRALTIYEKLDDKDEIANATSNLGTCYENEGEYTSALEAYFKVLQIDELTGYKEGMAGDYNSIAVIYKKQGDLARAIEFHKKAEQIHIEINDQYGLAVSYVNAGPLYKEMGEYDKALEILEKALSRFREMKIAMGEAIALHNIGSVYLMQKEFSDAVRYFRNSIEITKGDGSNSEVKVRNLIYLADAYAKVGRPDSAFVFAKQGEAMAQQMDNKEISLEVNKVLYDIFKLKNDYRNALSYHEKYLANKDSLFNNEKTSQFRELQTKYETEKKEQQIAILNGERALQENKLNNRALLLYASIGVIILIIIFSIAVVRSNRRRQDSERKLLNEQLKNKKIEADKLQEVDELKSRFFANIAHEFKTPLTLISGPVENLLEETKDKYFVDQLLLVKRNSSRLLSLINQLLDLSKLESGVTRLELYKDDIISFLKGLTFSFQSLADEKDITLECHTSVETLRMDFDRDKIEKIVFNLLSNAFKFTPSLGTIKVFIDRTTNNGTDSIIIKVADSGFGIPESQLPFIFNRFYQADNAQIRTADGSGIGLALTRELIELHGGNITVASTSGAGSVFTVHLPFRDDASVKESVLHEEPKIINGIESLKDSGSATEVSDNDAQKQEMVLVIEDNQEVREFIINSIKNSYHVIAATNGDEGIDMATSEIPDLIISDVMMPGKNGYETCRILKGDERTSHIPVILLTAKASFENKIEGLETGADDFIPKPFSTRELLVRIKNLITTRKKLREKYLDAALSDVGTAGHTIEDAFLVKIREAVEAQLDNSDFSIEDLSREIGMSRTQVHRKLKALTNQSASQFMRSIRLHHGKTLLQKGTLNVSEVAYKVGFNSPAYFSTCYVSQFGYSPSEESTRDK